MDVCVKLLYTVRVSKLNLLFYVREKLNFDWKYIVFYSNNFIFSKARDIAWNQTLSHGYSNGYDILNYLAVVLGTMV